MASQVCLHPHATLARGEPRTTASSRGPYAGAAAPLRARQRQQRADAPRRALRVRATLPPPPSEAEQLNQLFGITGHVEVVSGRGGLPTVRLTHANGGSAEVALFGGCITSWKMPAGDEVLYVRPDAVFDKSRPIAGGIPICFPQFGPGALQQHGFARNVDWHVASTSADPQPDDRDPEVTLLLTDNEYTRAMWPHSFKLAYSVSLHAELLRTDMRVINTGKTAFDFTAALHSYIEVADVSKAAVKGLKGLEYLDKASAGRDAPYSAGAAVPNPKSPSRKREEREAVTFSGPTDSVYLKARDYCELYVGTGAAVAITSNRWSDVVVWSPWDAMPDFYRSFVCVENAQFSEPVSLAPGEFWRSQCEWTVIDL
eukprot:scaffold21.g2215.t1